MRKAVFAVLFLFIIATAAAQLGAPTPFSGDMTMKGKRGQAMTGKIYFSGQKMRMDMNAEGHKVAQIMDMPNKVSYMLMPEQKMYMEFRAGQQQMHRGPKMPDLKSYDPTNPCSQAEDMTCEKAGSETVNGRNTDKWIFKKKSTGAEMMTVWLDKKIHYPIRTVSDDMQMDLTNIQEGMPAAALFEIPAGYQKFDMGAMMGGKMPE